MSLRAHEMAVHILQCEPCRTVGTGLKQALATAVAVCAPGQEVGTHLTQCRSCQKVAGRLILTLETVAAPCREREIAATPRGRHARTMRGLDIGLTEPDP